MMSRASPLLASLLLLTALPAGAQVYSWKDKDGRTQFSDIPPPRGEVRTLPQVRTPPPAAPAATGTAPAATGTASAAAERKPEPARADAPDSARKAADEAERQRFCEQARIQLGALNSGQRVARLNAAGAREFLDDKARATEAERLQQQIDKHCR
jgi:hypothetical protein